MLRKESERMARTIELGGKIDLEDFLAVVRDKAQVTFSEAYKARVNKSRAWWSSGWKRKRLCTG